MKLVILLLIALFATSGAALEVRLQGEQMSIKADHAPLMEVLKQLARYGVSVRVDPSVDALVSGDVQNADVQQTLDKLLENYGYVLIWNVIEGPVGSIPRLAEVQVFQPGHKEKIQPLPGIDENFAVGTGPDGRARFVKDEILIGFKAGLRRDAFDILIREIGGTVIASVPELGIYQIRLAPGANVTDLVEQLERNPAVAEVEPNYVAEVPLPAVQKSGEGGELPSLAAPSANAAPVAILDSGLTLFEGLTNAVIGAFDAVNPERVVADKLGHGTQMAMVAAGAVSPDGNVSGNAVPVVAIRAFDDNGNASNFSLMRSIAYAISKGARVINMSWGSETSSEFLQNAISYAQSKGAVVVAAAGNEPTGKAVYPAAYSGVVAVSALGSDGKLWDSSNRGDFVTISAPGTASFPIGYKGPAGSYAGTSISSAYVSHALAKYFTKHPGASAKEAISALEASVTDAGAKGRDRLYGFGTLDTAALGRLLK